MVTRVCDGSPAVISPTRSAKFFKSLDFARLLAEMTRPCRDVAKFKTPQNLANRALVVGDFPARPDHLLPVDAAPANHAVPVDLGAIFDQLGEFGFLFGRQPALDAGRLAIDQACRPRGVEPEHPIPQRLPIHSADPCRLRPVLAFIDRRDRH
jgi:hypothetical protein